MYNYNWTKGRSQYPHGLRRVSAAARSLGLWDRIPPGACMFVSCECCVLSGRSLCDRQRRHTRVWCFWETLIMRQPWLTRGCWAMKKLDERLSLDKHMCDYLLNIFLIFTSWVWLFLSFLVAFAKLQKATISFLMFVCPSDRLSVCLSAWNNSVPTEHIFVAFDIRVFFENLPENSSFIKIWHFVTFRIISPSVLLRIRNISDKRCWENHSTHLVFHNFFYEIM